MSRRMVAVASRHARDDTGWIPMSLRGSRADDPRLGAMTEDESESIPAASRCAMRLVVGTRGISTETRDRSASAIMFLSPVSIIAAIVGLVAGGDKPDVYFRRVQRFGRRSDLWINVFGARHRGHTADEMVRPIEESLLAQTRPGGRFERGAGHVNQLLDAVNRKNSGPRERRH